MGYSLQGVLSCRGFAGREGLHTHTHTQTPQTLSAVNKEQEMGVTIGCKNLAKGRKLREDTKANAWTSILVVAF